MKDVFKALRIFLLIIIISLISIFATMWFYSIAHCEYLTFRYGYQFEDLYKENPMLGDLYRFKVIEYNDDYAEVYYVTGNKETGAKGGDTLKFKRSGNKWIYTELWSTIWSNRGSADGFIWPYGR